MSDLFKEMCSLSGKLSYFVDYIKDKEDKKNLLEFYLKVTGMCEQVSNQEFDENDDFYLDTIEKIMDTGSLIKEFKEKKIKLMDVLDHLNTIINNVINIREIENEK
jgi:cell fate (sporulation/competence/biofilm development) regulator YlbF (YheA/YmcA/DUF963 family)